MTKTSSTKIDKVTDFSPANCTIAELKRFREDPKYAENIEELDEAIRRRESHQKKLQGGEEVVEASSADLREASPNKEHGEVHVHVQIVEVNERTGDETSRRAATPEETDAFIGQLDNWMGSNYRFGDFINGVADDMKVKAMKGNYAIVDFEFTSAAHAAEYTKGKPHLQMEVFDNEGDPGRDPTMEELETAVRAINDVVAEDFAEGLGVFSAYVYAEPASASASASDATKNVGKFTPEDWGACYELFVPVLEDLEKQPNLNRGMKARLNLLKRVEDKLMAYTEYAAEGYGDETPLTVKEMEALREIVENGGRADLAKAFAEW